jgi:hypothetical protein
VARDRLDRRSPVPRTIAQLDTAYLSRLLGSPVAAVESVDATAGTTDRARLRLRGDGVVPSAFVKMAPTKPIVRMFANLAGLGRVERHFYCDVRPGLAIEAPALIAVDADPATQRFVIVLEDLVARGARFTDAVTGMTLAEAGAMVDTLAVLHGAFWESPRLSRPGPGGLSWIAPNSRDPQLPVIQRALVAAGRKLARRGSDLAPPVGRRILERYLAVADELDAGPHTVLHGDPHPGNTYFVGDAGGLLDWQVVRRGNGVRDLTYMLVLGLEPDERRRHTGELLDRYRQRLAGAGGPELDAEALWRDHRRMAAYTYAAAAFTGGFGGLQSDGVALSGVRKAAAALDDLDTGRALSSLP